MASGLSFIFWVRLAADAGNIASDFLQYPPFGGYTGAVYAARIKQFKLQDALNSLTTSRSARSRFLGLHLALITAIQTLQPFSVTTFLLMKSKLGIIAIASILSACAAPARYEYSKEGASDFQRTDAMSECNYQIRLNKTAAAEQKGLLQLCMQGKGYRLRRVN